MTPKTKKIVTYILTFFFGVLFIILSFFIYRLFFVKIDYDFSFLKDSEFSKLMDRESDENKEYIEIEYLNCFFSEDIEVGHQERIEFFSRASVGPYESCSDFSKMRMCNDGEWTGDSKFKYKTCERMIDCRVDDETILKNGESIELYSRDKVDYGIDCERFKGVRTCKESFLIGNSDFKYKECSIDMSGVCNINGIALGDSQTRAFFSKEVVEYTDSCKNYMEIRVCSLGKLYGNEEYSYSTCTEKIPNKCILDGKEIYHDNSGIFYSKVKAESGHSCQFFAIDRKCTDGALDGLEEYKYSSCSE